MINGNLDAFMDSLSLGLELEVVFRGRRFFIQGWDWSAKNSSVMPHIEMFEIVDDVFAGYVFQYEGASRGECTEAFLSAKVWDGLTFAEAEPEIEWVG